MITRRQSRITAGPGFLSANLKSVKSRQTVVCQKKTDSSGAKLPHETNTVGNVGKDKDVGEIMDENAIFDHNDDNAGHSLYGETFISPFNEDTITSASDAENVLNEIQLDCIGNLFQSQQQQQQLQDVDVEFEEYFQCNNCLSNFISLTNFEAHDCFRRRQTSKNQNSVVTESRTAATSSIETALEPVSTHEFDKSNFGDDDKNNHKIMKQEPTYYYSPNSNSSCTNFDSNPCPWDDDDGLDSSTDPLRLHPVSFSDPLDGYNDDDYQPHIKMEQLDHPSSVSSVTPVCENSSPTLSASITTEKKTTILVPVQDLLKQLQSKSFLVTSLSPQKKVIRLMGSKGTVHDIFNSLPTLSSSSFDGSKCTPILLKPGRHSMSKLAATEAAAKTIIQLPPAKLLPEIVISKPVSPRSSGGPTGVNKTLTKSNGRKPKSKNARECYRRQELADNFTLVKSLVPWLKNNEKCSKVNILTGAVTYIDSLEEEEKILACQRTALQEKCDNLRTRVDEFRVV